MDPNHNSNFKNTNPNPPYQGFTQPSSVFPVSSKKKFSPSPLLIPILIAVLISSALSAGITYFIVRKKFEPSIFSESTTSEPSDVNVVSSVQTTGNESEDDVLRQLDERISTSSSDTSENFDNKITKIAFLFDYEKYDEVKSALDAIPLDNLSNFQLFQIYNCYARYYRIIEDSSEAEKYESLAKETEEKYIVE